MLLPITLTFAGVAGLLNIWLAMRVGRVRIASKVSHGDGGSNPLIKRMRAHANYVEYTPFVLILMGGIELAIGSAPWLWVVAAVYLLARVAHALGMDSDTPSKLRMIGILVTLVTIITLSVTALYTVYAGSPAPHAPSSIDAQG